MKEIFNYLKKKLYHLQSEGTKNKGKILWEKIPSAGELQKIIQAEFSVKLGNKTIKSAHESLQAYETKGKSITKQDLQNIIEEHMDEYEDKKKQLEIIDFETKTSKYKKASASVKLKIGGKELIGQAEGVGTVDAIITAVKEIITAIDKKDNRIIAQATSPDVIVASINAFEKCYNFLYHKRSGKAS